MRNWSVIETSIWIQIGFLGWEKQLCIDQAPVKKLVPVTSLLWAPGLSSYRNKNAQENIFRFFLNEAFISSKKFLIFLVFHSFSPLPDTHLHEKICKTESEIRNHIFIVVYTKILKHFGVREIFGA